MPDEAVSPPRHSGHILVDDFSCRLASGEAQRHDRMHKPRLQQFWRSGEHSPYEAFEQYGIFYALTVPEMFDSSEHRALAVL
jgi:hypothetical protein